MTKDNKSLVFDYDVKSCHLTKGQQIEVSMERSFAFSEISGDLSIEFSKPRLSLVIQLRTSDRQMLFKLLIVISFLLGENVLLTHFYENFPLPVPRGYNIGGYNFDFVLTRKLILKPIEQIEVGLRLLDKKESCFSKILASMLQINNLDLVDVRFFGEYVLLEGLAASIAGQDTILTRKNDSQSYKSMGNLLERAILEVDQCSYLSKHQKELLKRNLSFERINRKGSTKEKIFAFIDGLGESFEEFKKYIPEWTKLRNSRIAHGSQKSLSEDEIILMRELHRFLCKILVHEYESHSRLQS